MSHKVRFKMSAMINNTYRYLNHEQHVLKLAERIELINETMEVKADQVRREVQELRDEFETLEVQQKPLQQIEILFQLYR